MRISDWSSDVCSSDLKPGSKTYGRLSVMAGWRCDLRVLFNLPARAFTPPPKVASSVVRFTPLPSPRYPAAWDAMETVVAAAFGQRRQRSYESRVGKECVRKCSYR